jgi:sugar lactone lactonase YvrE
MKKQLFSTVSILCFLALKFCQAQIITTYAGDYSLGAGYSGDGGSALSGQMYYPHGVAVGSLGKLSIADQGNNIIRKVVSGNIYTIAGNYALGAGYSGDGGPSTAAQLNGPFDVAYDKSGNLYIADYGNNLIRKVVGGFGTITTFAGDYALGAGYSGDGGAAVFAQLSSPTGIAFDASGNLYIADAGNNVIRMVSTSGTISTVAGNNALGAGYSGDGSSATSAQLNNPVHVIMDNTGVMYISDNNNNVVRKVAGGIISTYAGNGTLGYSGDGGAAKAAELDFPYGLAIDKNNLLYISDEHNNVIRKVDATGKISTVVGDYSFGAGYSGDGGSATLAELYHPNGIVFDPSGNLYIGDIHNNVIREVTGITGIQEISGEDTPINIYPNPANNELRIEALGNVKYSNVEMYSILGSKVIEQKFTTNKITLNVQGLSAGMYLVKLNTTDGSYVVKKLEIQHN